MMQKEIGLKKRNALDYAKVINFVFD